MKTSLLYRYHGHEVYRRACLPGDDNTGEDERRIKSLTIRFIAAHEVSGTKLSLTPPYRGKPFTRIEPDCVAVEFNDFKFKNSVADGIKIIPPEYVFLMDEIDDKIDRLHAERNRLMSEAWRRGTSLRKSDVNGAEPK